VADPRAKSAAVRCACGADLDIPLDRTWWVSYRARGRVHRRKVGPDRRLAETVEKKILTQIAEGRFLDVAGEDGTMRLSELGRLYWSSPAGQRRRLGYAAKEQKVISGLLEHLGDCQLIEITTEKLEGWAAKVSDDLKPGTISRRLIILSAMLSWAVRQGHLRHRPRFPTIRGIGMRTAWATREQARALLDSIQNPVTRDAVELAFALGLRRGELCGLEWSMVNMDAGVVSLPAELCKNGRGRALPMNETARRVLRRRLADARPGAPVFHRDGERMSAGGLSQTFKTTARRAGLTGLCLHSARHSCLTWLVSSGVGLLTAGELAGHSALTMTARYSHVDPNGLRAAVLASELPASAVTDPAPGNAGVRPAETKVLSFPQKVAESAG